MDIQIDYEAQLGDFLGGGSFRRAYRKKGTKTRVIKVAKAPEHRAHNYLEYMIYNSAPPMIKKFLCPVYAISPDGQYLVMRYAADVAYSFPAHKKPAILDKWFGDICSSNLGRIGKRIVARDYSLLRIPEWNTGAIKVPYRDYDSKTGQYKLAACNFRH